MGYQQPMYSPYQNGYPFYQQQRLQQFEQMYPQQVQQVQGINGRLIDDISTVNANEVTMDGSIAVFPMRDMSKIFVKRWNANGIIETSCFEPIKSEEVDKPTQDNQKGNYVAFSEFTDTILSKIDALEKKIDSIGVKTTTTRTKKESE